MSEKGKSWIVYILRCADKSLYTGITIDINRRLNEHNYSALGAKYTRARRPVVLVYEEVFSNRSLAAQQEYKIKRLVKQEKEALICEFQKIN